MRCVNQEKGAPWPGMPLPVAVTQLVATVEGPAAEEGREPGGETDHEPLHEVEWLEEIFLVSSKAWPNGAKISMRRSVGSMENSKQVCAKGQALVRLMSRNSGLRHRQARDDVASLVQIRINCAGDDRDIGMRALHFGRDRADRRAHKPIAPELRRHA